MSSEYSNCTEFLSCNELFRIPIINVLDRDAAVKYPCRNGISGDTYPCNNIDMYSYLSLEDLGGGNVIDDEPFGNDIWGWTDDSGNEYALAGLADGTSIVDLSDPAKPNAIAFIESHNSAPSYWRDIKTFRSWAYIVQDFFSGGTHGLQYVNLDTIIQLAEQNNDDDSDIYYVASNNQYNYQELSINRCHNIFINEDSAFLYAVGGNEGK